MPRIVKFYCVGFVGAGVQLGTLALLTLRLGWHYPGATLVAVEAAILHNFWWHRRWTWKNRLASSRLPTWKSLLGFHLASGAAALPGNLLLMGLLVDGIGLPPLLSNLAAIGACSIVTYLASDRWVFQSRP